MDEVLLIKLLIKSYVVWNEARARWNRSLNYIKPLKIDSFEAVSNRSFVGYYQFKFELGGGQKWHNMMGRFSIYYSNNIIIVDTADTRYVSGVDYPIKQF